MFTTYYFILLRCCIRSSLLEYNGWWSILDYIFFKSQYIWTILFYITFYTFPLVYDWSQLYCSHGFLPRIHSEVPKSIRYAVVAPVCKHVLNSGGWNATPPPFNMPEEVHGALKHETISLVCEVEANPTNVTFHWTFNNSGDLSEIPSTKYTNEGTISRLNYTPSTDMDYGILGCWASNAVGHSKQPCLYQVIAAGLCKFSALSLYCTCLFIVIFNPHVRCTILNKVE